METGPIFRALLHNRSRFALIALEIALTLAIVVNCLNMMGDHRAKWERPTGMDVDNLLLVESLPFAPEFKQKAHVEASFEQDLRALRAHPGVMAATAMSAVPLSGGGSMTGRKVIPSDMEEISLPFYVVATDALETLGVELVEGRDFTPEDFVAAAATADVDGVPRRSNIIITRDVAERLFPDGNALGSTIGDEDGNRVETVVGIIRRMHCSWPLSGVAERVELLPGRPASGRQVRYLVRAEPGMLASLYTGLEEELLRLDSGRIIETKTLQEMKSRRYRALTALNQLLAGVSVLLLLVTGLGIVGLTSFSVTQRTRQIGTRRALGATRRAILRYFLVENWIVTGVGLAVGIGLSYGLNFLLAHYTDVPRMGWALIATCMLLLWAAGLLAALAPAWRGTRVPPVVATRSV